MKKKVIVFGGAFNPPTKGHEAVIRELLNCGDEVWVFPSYAHAHGKKPISFKKRIELTQILVDIIGDKRVLVKDDEKECFELLRKDYVYTYDLLVFLSNKYKDIDFVFSCGSDNAIPETWSKFYNSSKIDSEFGKIVVDETFNIRSTYIRDAIKNKDYSKLKDYSYPEIIEKVIDNY